jgi:hypothetical protein
VKKLEFRVKLEGTKGTQFAALTPPFDIQEVFQTRGRVPVRGTINGFPFRSSLMPMGGCHRMAVNQTIRDGARVKAGDTVTVQMERDEEERVVEVPPPLRKALAKSQAARANWARLSYTHQKEIARSIREAKKEETRARRLEKAIDILKTASRGRAKVLAWQPLAQCLPAERAEFPRFPRPLLRGRKWRSQQLCRPRRRPECSLGRPRAAPRVPSGWFPAFPFFQRLGRRQQTPRLRVEPRRLPLGCGRRPR